MCKIIFLYYIDFMMSSYLQSPPKIKMFGIAVNDKRLSCGVKCQPCMGELSLLVYVLGQYTPTFKYLFKYISLEHL